MSLDSDEGRLIGLIAAHVVVAYVIVNGVPWEGPDSREEIRRMQDGVRRWVLRSAGEGSQRLRKVSPPVLLSLLCAAAFSPLVAVGAGISGAVAVAGAGVLSSVGGGVLSSVIAAALDRLRKQAGEQPTAEDAEREIAGEIQRVLSVGDARAEALSAEIAAVLQEINAGGTALREAVETGNERVRSDVVAAIGALSTAFAGMQFLLGDIAAAAAEIQASQDAHAAQLRVIIDRVGWAATEARLTREEAAAWRISGADASGTAATGRRPRWIRGSPYRGLRPFDEADAEVFYGRERVTAELVGRVAGQLDGTGILLVTGASGAGKSSLLRAGLVPALARGLQLSGSERWPRLVMTPTRNPLTELATHLAVLSGTDTTVIREVLVRQPGQAHLAVRQALLSQAARTAVSQRGGRDGQRLVLIVDQFEQVFTLSRGVEAEAEAFITALCAAASNPAGPDRWPPAMVVIAVRGDFWDRCAAHPQLVPSLRRGQFIVGPMTETELRLAIAGPAEAAGLQIDPALTKTILSDLNAAGGDNAAGVLPLLSQAMLLTWDKREGTWLTSHGYGQSGGVSRAVQTSADNVYDDLPARQQELAQQLFRSMTITSREGRLTRRPVTRASLYDEYSGADRRDVDVVLDAFADQRLIVLDEGTAQIAHDALLTTWPRLRGWLEEDQANWALHTQLRDDATAWDDSSRDPSFLYRGTELAAFRQAAAQWEAGQGRYPALTATQRAFLDVSERGAARRNRQRRILAGTLIVLLIASVAGAIIASVAARTASRQRDLANQQRNLAVSGQLAAQSDALDAADPVTAALLAAAAAHFDLTRQARDSLLDVAAQPERAVLASGADPRPVLAFSPDGRTLAITSSNGVGLWNVSTHRQIGRPLATSSNLETLTFSPDGKVLASADQHGTARMWNIATHREIGTPLRTNASTSALVFTSSAVILAAATGANYSLVRFWDLTTHRQMGTPVTVSASVTSLTFSPGGAFLGAVTANGAKVWNTATGIQLPSPVIAGPMSPDQVVFSSGGKLLATVDGSRAVLSETATGQQTGPAMPVQGGMLATAAFSPDAAMLATGGSGGIARLWDTADHHQIGILQTGASPVRALAFSPAGKLLATVDEVGQTQLWDVTTWRQIGAPIVIGDDVNIIVGAEDISPDSKILAIGENGGVAQLWDTATRRRLAVLSPPGAINYSDVTGAVAFSPDGKILAVGNGNGTAQLWSVAARHMVGAPLQFSGTDGPSNLAFNPNGKLLAAATPNGVQFVNVATGQPIGTLMTAGKGSEAGVSSLAFSPDGRTLSGANAGTAQLWDVVTHRGLGAFRIAVPFAPGTGYNQLGAMAFSPSGKILATATAGTIQLWDMTTHRQIGAPLNLVTESGDPTAMGFSPDGNFLAVAVGGTVSLWDITTRQQIGTALPATPIHTSSPSALIFSPDGRTLAAIGMDGAWLWNVALPKNLITTACSITGRSLTTHEWNLYVPSEPFQKVCG